MTNERPRCEEHGKVCYASRNEANGALKAVRKIGGGDVPRRSYWDEECGSYHLTSKPDLSTSRKTARGSRRRRGSRKSR